MADFCFPRSHANMNGVGDDDGMMMMMTMMVMIHDHIVVVVDDDDDDMTTTMMQILPGVSGWLRCFFQGEIVAARFDSWPPPDDMKPDEEMGIVRLLQFGDGSQKMLAAMITWICILLVWKGHGPDALRAPMVQTMIRSFLAIATTVKSTEIMSSPLDAMMGRIADQNVAARVQPISSFQWAGILVNFLQGDRDSESFDDMIQKYNSHPVVVAHDRNESGSGSIALDGRKKMGVRNWVERCSPEAYDVVLNSMQDLPYLLGPFGESFAYTNLYFLGSKAGLDTNPDTNSVDGPMEGESSVEVL